ncbi:MAG: Na+/proline symporter [Cyanobacteria bacterium J06560_6]
MTLKQEKSVPQTQKQSYQDSQGLPQTQNPAYQDSQSVLDDYIVCRNQLSGQTALATITASLMGGWIVFSPLEGGSQLGGLTVVLGYCLGIAAVALLFALVGPRLRQIMPWGYSLSEYVQHRFNSPKSKGKGIFAKPLYWLVVAVMLLYMFVYMGLQLTAIIQIVGKVYSFGTLGSSLIVTGIVFSYVTIGGLKASFFTDKFHFIVILPLLFFCSIAMIFGLGGWNEAIRQVVRRSPELLSLSNLTGIRFGVGLIIALTVSELFNQAHWQRVYACKDEQTVRRAFTGSILAACPLLLALGMVGIVAVGQGISGIASFFDLLNATLPNWVLSVVVLLALALVMSSMDSLLNGITAVFTGEVLRFSPSIVHRDKAELHALITARVLTISIGLAVVTLTLGLSIFFTLFFIADVLCAAIAFPIMFSLFSRHQTATNAFFSSLAGIAAGASLVAGGDFLNTLAAALIASTASTLLWTGFDKKFAAVERFSYSDLRDKSYAEQMLVGK